MLALNQDLVAVIDDDDDGRDTLIDDLAEQDFQGIPIVGRFGSDIEQLLNQVEALNPGFVICDHRLTAKQFATFTGLDIVERLIERHYPAMLVTMYQESEWLVLREARARVPVIKVRDHFEARDVPSLRNIVMRELAHEPVASRRPHRVLLHVEAVRDDQIDAIVPSWNRDHAFVVPKTLIGEAVRNAVRPGNFLLGDVNIGADSEHDIYFANVDEIVEPIEDDF